MNAGRRRGRVDALARRDGVASTALALKQALGELKEEDREFVDEPCLKRYLQACFGDVTKAAVQLRGTLEWRREFKPDRVLTNQLERFVLKEKNYFAGRAPDGLSVLVTRKRVERLLPEDEDSFLRYIVYSVEKAIQAMKDGVDQWVWILDLKGYTSGNSPRLSMTRKTIHVLAEHYPVQFTSHQERLKCAYIVDAPTIFYVLYKVVYPFLDKVTAQKIAFVYSSYYDINGQLLPGKKDDSGFSTYYKQYAKQYDPETYLASLKEQERALLQ